ncbi:MAG: hypothetical protein M0006_09585 [Magnetospirillum sp.]|nr:hypothetical protein [Magnetospirillum sp.]
MTEDTDIFNAADADAVGREQRKAERAESRRLAAFKAVMATPEGRRYVWWLLERCGVFRTSFTGDSATFFNEGQRNVGLTLLGDIHAVCPEHYLTMLTEAEEDTNG